MIFCTFIVICKTFAFSPKERFLLSVCAVTMKYFCIYLYIYIIHGNHRPPEACFKCQGALFFFSKNLVYRYFTISGSCARPCAIKFIPVVCVCDVVKTAKMSRLFLAFAMVYSSKIKQHFLLRPQCSSARHLHVSFSAIVHLAIILHTVHY